jgi:hypothetical protein
MNKHQKRRLQQKKHNTKLNATYHGTTASTSLVFIQIKKYVKIKNNLNERKKIIKIGLYTVTQRIQ